jgi:prepilin peptidase CpaA
VQGLLHGVTDGLLFGLGGGFTGALLMFPGYMLRMTGAGDVKLMAATGAFCGVLGAVEIVLATCVIGGIWSLATMLKRRQMRAGLQGVAAMLVTLQTRSSGPRDPSASPATQSVGTLPYGVAIALGTVVVLFSSI